MAISATYLVLQEQIADELGDRTDLLSPLSDSSLTLSPIKNAIQSAIALWERETFYFNTIYDVDAFNTVSGTELYTSSDYAPLGTMAYLKKLHIKINSNRYALVPRPWDYLEDISVNPSSTSSPFDWAFFAGKLRLYPIPDGAYPITLSGITRATALSATSDSNVWTQDGFDLIRSQAKLVLAQEVLHDPELAAEMKAAIYGDPGIPRSRGYLGVLKGETARRNARGKIRPTYF